MNEMKREWITFIKLPLNTLAAVIGLSLILNSGGAMSADASGDKTPFLYVARQEMPDDVIRSIASSFGYRVSGSTGYRDPISSRISGRGLTEALQDLSRAYRFDWYISAGVLYIYKSSDWTTESIPVVKPSAGWDEQLKSADLSIEKFKVIEQPGGQAVLVTAPRSYIHLFRQAFQANPEDLSRFGGRNESLDLMVFKLKHASVDDREFNFRDQKVVTPGVLSVLRGVIENKGTASKVNQPQNQSQRGLLGKASAMQSNDSRGGNAGRDEPPGSPTMLRQPGSSVIPESGQANRSPIVQGDPRSNTIIIRDDRSRYTQYKTLIDQLDVPLAMIEIEAMLIDIDQKKLDELGFEFGFRNNSLAYDFPGEGAGRPSTFNNNSIANGAVINNKGKFLAQIRALEGNQDAKVLARPTILTQDNLGAFIDLTQTLYVRVVGERVADVVPVTAGSLLKVLPRVIEENGDRKIFLQVDIQDGSLKNSQGIELPQVENSSISTQAVILQNQAILIGGYNRETTQKNEYKVPLLGDLPLIGKLMQSNENRSQKVSRLFMITPRVVLPENSNQEPTATGDAPRVLPMRQRRLLEGASGTNGLKYNPSMKIIANP
ncbi:type III secretion system outer membrane ring subunit SctC [Limnobacter humi]|uniref:Type III secretion system outer membrane ring subunit SctC n=1 Tax=Limnobacter humi TaxID=1778671 RepID=A0ABT1WDE5_9BURK|nr:type III secretion system outer membrane ring subunit SctC [Limnobacter humi]MCQ8895542.1 type III secretion system outer membrane ring subunit SctC [Limnobacter humi]